jgi:tetratricopeptide (TPR) repeat protein
MQLRGRDRELKQLQDAYASAATGKPQLVWLEGEPGSGKTRLLQELYHVLSRDYDPPQPEAPDGYWATASDSAGLSGDNLRPSIPARKQQPAMPWFWWGLRCSAGSEHNPDSFQAYVDGLDELERHLGGMEAARRRRKAGLAFAAGMVEMLAGLAAPLHVLYTSAVLVKKLHDDLHSAHSTGPAELREVASRAEDVLLRLLAALNASSSRDTSPVPVIIVIDDAQWADARSVAFTRRLLLEAQSASWQLLVVLAVRDTDLAAQAPAANGASRIPAVTLPELRANVIRVAGASTVTGISLGALDSAAAVLLLQDAFDAAGRVAAPATIEHLLEQAGGHPFFLVHYMRHVLDRGWLDAAGELTCTTAELEALPRDIGALLQERLRVLPAAEYEALQWGSVQGQRFVADLTARVAAELGRSSAQTLLDLGRARDEHKLIEPAPESAGFPRPRYAFAQRLLREQILAAASPETRALVQSCLVDLLGGYLDSGQLELLPLDESRSALEMLAAYPAADQSGQERAALAAGMLCYEHVAIQDYRSAEPWADRLWQWLQRQPAENRPQVVDRSWVYLRAVFETYRLRARWDDALGLLTLMQSVTPEESDPLRQIQLLSSMGRIHEARGDNEAALEHYRRGHDASIRAGAAYEAGKVVGKIAGIRHSYGEFEQAKQLYGESLAALQQAGDTDAVSRTMNNLALVYESTGEYDKALELLDAALAMKIADGDSHGTAQTLNNIGNLHQARGANDLALEHYRRSLDALQRIGDRQGVAQALGNVGIAYAALGQHGLALENYEESVRLFRRMGAEHGAALTLGDMANVYRERGDIPRALELYAESIAGKRSAGDDYGAALTLEDMGLAHVLRHDPDPARIAWSEAVDLFGRCGLEEDAARVAVRLLEL